MITNAELGNGVSKIGRVKSGVHDKSESGHRMAELFCFCVTRKTASRHSVKKPATALHIHLRLYPSQKCQNAKNSFRLRLDSTQLVPNHLYQYWDQRIFESMIG
jgi:hypothetical protein